LIIDWCFCEPSVLGDKAFPKTIGDCLAIARSSIVAGEPEVIMSLRAQRSLLGEAISQSPEDCFAFARSDTGAGEPEVIMSLRAQHSLLGEAISM
jgi:hypothetical protein